MCFIIQARPVKLFLKEALYILLRNPPGIFLSLLPAPQQACLSLSQSDAMSLIYGKDASNDDMDLKGAIEDEEENDETEEEPEDSDVSSINDSSDEDD
jgi:hypothetical protein